jgi:DNA-binding Xre family transcriptional regulator
MIRNEAEYKKAVDRIAAERVRIDALRKELEASGLAPDEIKRAVDPIQSFHLQLVEEVDEYDRLRRGEFTDLINFYGIGRLLVSLRIYRGMTQRELAAELGVHESQVSRDERNEYHGITVSRATRIFEILGARLHTTVERVDRSEHEILVG